MKTKHEIIDEVASSYNSKTRALNEKGGCVYETFDGRCCAVGRYIDTAKADRRTLFSSLSNTGVIYAYRNASTAEHITLEDILKDDCKGHEASFWRDLQRLHDDKMNWSKDGLSNVGKQMLKNIKKKYA